MRYAILWAVTSSLAVGGVGCDEPRSPRVVVDRDPAHPLGRGDSPALEDLRTSRRARLDHPPDRSGHQGSRPAGEPKFRQITGEGYAGHVRLARGDGQWIPGDGDIADLERRLPASARSAAATGAIPADIDLASYVRQYRGHDRNGDRHVDVTLYCPESGNLASMDVSIAGGGECLVFAAYDTVSQRFIRWSSRARSRPGRE